MTRAAVQGRMQYVQPRGDSRKSQSIFSLLAAARRGDRSYLTSLLKDGAARHELVELGLLHAGGFEVEVATDGYGRARTRRERPGELKKGAGPPDLVVLTHPPHSDILVRAVVAQEEAGASRSV